MTMVTECHHGDLTRRLAARINERAGHSIRGLAVSYCHGKVQVRGTARSFYGWQLAIAACRELLLQTPTVNFDCLMRVEKSSSMAGE
jgi:hypothetical protein